MDGEWLAGGGSATISALERHARRGAQARVPATRGAGLDVWSSMASHRRPGRASRKDRGAGSGYRGPDAPIANCPGNRDKVNVDSSRRKARRRIPVRRCWQMVRPCGDPGQTGLHEDEVEVTLRAVSRAGRQVGSRWPSGETDECLACVSYQPGIGRRITISTARLNILARMNFLSRL